MLRAPDRLSFHLGPVYALVQLLIHEPAHHHIVSSHQIQAMRLLARGLLIVWLAYDALDCVGEYQVRDLIAGYEGAGEGPAVDCDDEDFFCVRGRSVILLMHKR